MNAVSTPPGIHRVRMQMAYSPMAASNAYLLEAGEGWALVDCGLDLPTSLAALQSTLDELGGRLEDIHTLIATHHHADHYGMAGTLKSKIGKIRLAMHRIDWAYVRDHLVDEAAVREEMLIWLQRNGLSLEGRSEAELNRMSGVHHIIHVPPDVELEDGDSIQVGSHTLRALLTPGHSVGHLCLYDAVRRLLFSGDHVLDPMTPHVTTSRPLVTDLLTGCMESLRRLIPLEVEVVLPGHGEPFTGLGRRVEELLAYHQRRETDVLAALAQGPAMGAEVAARIPWNGRRFTFEQLPAGQQRAALGRTIAHLERLRALGQASREPRNRHIYWKLSY